MMAPLRKVGSILFATIAIGSGFFLGFANPIGTLGEPIDLAPVNGGAELVFVYIGSSTCAPSNAPELTLAIERLRESTRAEAERRGVAFATIGIARNRIAGMGIEHLSKYANWD